MDKRINKLEEIIANKIAAGEVVDRPASVVKELVENSIDALSTKITIDIKNAGKTHIRISDNGVGIHPEDVLIAFQRHATSKIKKVEDLGSILSLGFRGEALASIAAVSQLELITKSANYNIGKKVVIHGGKIIHNDHIGAPVGTTILIKNLFYNVPARFEFMKSNAAETSHIIDIVSKLALANPNISFRFINNDKLVFVTNGKGDIVNNIASIYGKEIAKNLIEIEEEVNNTKIKGYLCNPSVTKGNKKLQTFFVNKRYVKSKTISEAVLEAYKTLITINRHAVCFIYIDILPNMIDINIHPAKTEIRFKDDENVKKDVSYVLKKGLFMKSLIPSVRSEEKKKNEINIINRGIVVKEDTITENKKVKSKEDISEEAANKEKVIDNYIDKEENKNNELKEFDKTDENIIENVSEEKIIIKENPEVYKPSLPSVENHKTSNYIPKPIMEDNIVVPSMFVKEETKEEQQSFIPTIVDKSDENILDIKIIGQLFNSYLLGQWNEKLYMIDQHAAHERILYEWFLKKFKKQQPLKQVLLIPIVIEFSIYEFEQLKEYIHIFNNLGYDMEEFGDNTFRITAVPVVFGKPEATKFFKEVAESFCQINSSYEAKIEKIISMACKSAIKANDKLNDIEIDKLMKELSQTDNPYTCPHGRPVIISMSKYEIERKFKRK